MQLRKHFFKRARALCNPSRTFTSMRRFWPSTTSSAVRSFDVTISITVMKMSDVNAMPDRSAEPSCQCLPQLLRSPIAGLWNPDCSESRRKVPPETKQLGCQAEVHKPHEANAGTAKVRPRPLAFVLRPREQGHPNEPPCPLTNEKPAEDDEVGDDPRTERPLDLNIGAPSSF